MTYFVVDLRSSRVLGECLTASRAAKVVRAAISEGADARVFAHSR